MRKTLLLLTVICLLAVTVLASGYRAMDDQKDEISITEETIYGDPAAVDGLTVSVTTHRDSRLIWETSYEAGPEPQAATEFRFYTQALPGEIRRDHGHFNLQIGGFSYGMAGDDIDLESIEDNELDPVARHYDQMVLPAIDVASRTAAGETRTETLRLADYYDHMRLFASYNLDGIFDWSDDPATLRVLRALNDYFPIPVPQNIWVEVTVSKDSVGRITDVDSWDASYDKTDEPWEARVQSAVTADGIFLALSGNADYSQIADGYGLYWLPIVPQDGETPGYLDAAHLENVYPMDLEQVSDVGLMCSRDETQLYMTTREGADVWLTVLDCRTMEEVQRICLGSLDELPTFWMEENVVALVSGSYEREEYRLQVFTPQNGQLEWWLDTALFPHNKNEYWYLDPTLLFDGETLVIGCFRDNWNQASHRLCLYDQTGLQYAGDYFHTADHLPDRPFTESPGGLHLQWQ